MTGPSGHDDSQCHVTPSTHCRTAANTVNSGWRTQDACVSRVLVRLIIILCFSCTNYYYLQIDYTYDWAKWPWRLPMPRHPHLCTAGRQQSWWTVDGGLEMHMRLKSWCVLFLFCVSLVLIIITICLLIQEPVIGPTTMSMTTCDTTPIAAVTRIVQKMLCRRWLTTLAAISPDGKVIFLFFSESFN